MLKSVLSIYLSDRCLPTFFSRFYGPCVILTCPAQTGENHYAAQCAQFPPSQEK